MKFKAFLRAVASVALALLLIALGGAAFLRAQIIQTTSPQAVSSRHVPEAIAFIPSRTLALGTLLVDATDWESERIAAVPLDQQRAFRRGLGQIKHQLRRFGVRYNRDIKPWIGEEVTAALVSLDEDRNVENGSQPGYLIAIATDDPSASRAFLERFWQRRPETQPQTVRQAGIDITYAPPSASSEGGLATAHVGRQFVLMANRLSVLQDALTSAQVPPLNIRSRRRYETAIAQLPSERVGFVLADLTQAESWLPSSLTELIQQRITEGNWAGASDLLVAAVTQTDGDLLLQLALTPRASDAIDLGSTPREKMAAGVSSDASGNLPAGAGPPYSLERWLPSTSAAAILDRDLADRWSGVMIEDASPLAASTLTAIAPPELASLGIDSREIRDWVVPWVHGSYAIAKLVRPDAATDWLFVTPTSPGVIGGFDHLDTQAQAQGLTVGQIPYGQHQLTVWTELSAGVPSNDVSGDIPTLIAEVKGVHAMVDDVALLATSIGAIAQALQTTEADRVATAVTTLGPSPNGYLHLAWPEARALIETSSASGSALADVLEQLDGIVDAITLTRYGAETTGRDHVGLFIDLKG